LRQRHVRCNQGLGYVHLWQSIRSHELGEPTNQQGAMTLLGRKVKHPPCESALERALHC
jgi:hypothetical protein